MSKKQTRRSVSLSGRTYARAQAYAAKLGVPLSAYVERLVLSDLSGEQAVKRLDDVPPAPARSALGRALDGEFKLAVERRKAGRAEQTAVHKTAPRDGSDDAKRSGRRATPARVAVDKRQQSNVRTF